MPPHFIIVDGGNEIYEGESEIRSCSSADDTFYETLLCHDKGILTLTHCL